MRKHYDVIIATPGHSMHASYVDSLMRTVEMLNREGISFVLSNAYSSYVPHAREFTALGRGEHIWDSNEIYGGVSYNKIFWIDSDMGWDPENFLKLYRSELDIVSGIYATDQYGTVAVSYSDKKGRPTRVNKVEFLLHDKPVKVAGVGFGFVCVKAGVFEAIKRPWFAAESFELRDTLEEGQEQMVVNYGEDYSWCIKAQRTGYEIWVDPLVRVGHNKQIIFRAD
jgi:hypothetical protein